MAARRPADPHDDPVAGPPTPPLGLGIAATASALAVAERRPVLGPAAPGSGQVIGVGTPGPQRRRRPLPNRARQPGRPIREAAPAAAPAVGEGPAAAAASPPPGTTVGGQSRRRDGVVVPLRPPWTTRLRATAGLVLMVACLGAGDGRPRRRHHGGGGSGLGPVLTARWRRRVGRRVLGNDPEHRPVPEVGRRGDQGLDVRGPSRASVRRGRDG